jgi:hypothetical protein
MGLFGKKKVSVTVHGSTSTMTGSDGRYAKQARSLKKAGRERARNLDLVARSARELCSWIESTYKVEPLPEEDALFIEAKDDLEAWEPLDLHLYQILVMQGVVPAAWLTVYIEANHEYLAFRETELECRDSYEVNRVKNDIIRYYGADEEDKKQKNYRYTQFINTEY